MTAYQKEDRTGGSTGKPAGRQGGWAAGRAGLSWRAQRKLCWGRLHRAGSRRRPASKHTGQCPGSTFSSPSRVQATWQQWKAHALPDTVPCLSHSDILGRKEWACGVRVSDHLGHSPLQGQATQCSRGPAWRVNTALKTATFWHRGKEDKC